MMMMLTMLMMSGKTGGIFHEGTATAMALKTRSQDDDEALFPFKVSRVSGKEHGIIKPPFMRSRMRESLAQKEEAHASAFKSSCSR